MSASDSSHEDFGGDPGHSETEKPVHKSSSPKFSTSKLQNDIKMLEDGSFSDCVVICRDQTWKTHKVILSRCPYFARAFSSSSGFKEATESKITIENFEPFEISWLLQYIYGLRIDADQSRNASPSKSFLETCALLWGIGDFFLLPDMRQSVRTQSRVRCIDLYHQSRYASVMRKEICFLGDLEAGIRAAWRHDRVASPVRRDLISVCVGIHPFAKDHASFICLLDEIPEFTAQYVKALLDCPGMSSIDSRISFSEIPCFECGKTIFGDKGSQASDEFFVWEGYDPGFGIHLSGLFCSMDCCRPLKTWFSLGSEEVLQSSDSSLGRES